MIDGGMRQLSDVDLKPAKVGERMAVYCSNGIGRLHPEISSGKPTVQLVLRLSSQKPSALLVLFGSVIGMSTHPPDQFPAATESGVRPCIGFLSNTDRNRLQRLESYRVHVGFRFHEQNTMHILT